MGVKRFICPNGDRVMIEDCLNKCPQRVRCMGKPTLEAVANSVKDRGLGKIYSVTELISGTREVYLKKTTDYAVDPQDQIFAMHGTAVHSICEKHSSSFTLTSLNNGAQFFPGIHSSGKSFLNVSDFEKYKPWNGEEFSGKIKYQLDNKEEFEVFKQNCIQICKDINVDPRLSQEFSKDGKY